MSDLAWRLFRQGYDAVGADRADRAGGDDYRSRMLGRRAVVLRSPAGARTFYDESVVTRHGAVPPPLAWLLFGRGAIHGLDAPEHRGRKAVFLDLLTPERISPLARAVDELLRERTATWAGRDVAVHDELVGVYGAAVLAWAGVPLRDEDAQARNRQLAAIVDGFGFAGPAYARAWRARVGANRWAGQLVQGARDGRFPVEPGTALDSAARADLPARVAGVELLNVLRPTVAVAWLGTFAALRCAQHPDWKARLTDPDGGASRLAFAQEVRRTTPFVPALAGRVRYHAEICGVRVRPGQRLVLDVLGIDHDPARWPDPERFDPGRFLTAAPGPFDFVPQGGGDPAEGHRCPGESVALRLLDVTVEVLAGMDYSVTSTAVDRSRMPTLPHDGLVVRASETMSRASA